MIQVTLPEYFKSQGQYDTKRGGGQGHDAIFSMNFESLCSYQLDSTCSAGAAEEYLQGFHERFIEHLECPIRIHAYPVTYTVSMYVQA